MVYSPHTFRQEMERGGRMEGLQTGPEFGNVSRKLKEGIIKGPTVPKVHRTLNRDRPRILRIEGHLLREHVVQKRLLLQRNDGGLPRMSDDGLPLHHDPIGQMLRRLCAVRHGLQQICPISHEPLMANVPSDRGIRLTRDVRTPNRSRFQASRRDGGALLQLIMLDPHPVTCLIRIPLSNFRQKMV